MNNKIGIYKITSPNNRVYIGQSRNIPKRLKGYGQDWFLKSNKQPRLVNSINKYGYRNHKFEVVEYCDLSQLNKKERYYQDKYKVTSELGLNCDLTESNAKVRVRSLKTRLKISKSNKGKKRTDETKMKISQTLKGNKLPFCVRLKISKGNKGKKMSDSFKNDISKRMTGSLNHQAKIVLNTSNGIFYETITEAANAYNIKSKSLSNMLNGWQNNVFPQLIKV